jgi:type II secretory pathway pseudopilin PulG
MATAVPRVRRSSDGGLTILELMFTVAIGATITAIAIPLWGNFLDETRTVIAARYVEGQIMAARMDAVKRSRAVGLRFEPWGGDYIFAPYVDGNGNGIRTADIAQGVDAPLAQAGRLADKYPGVRFELLSGIPDIDGNAGALRDGLRIGAARILTMSPDGSSSSGTLYVRGRRAQYAVRVFGVTGRTRVLQYRPGESAWIVR